MAKLTNVTLKSLSQRPGRHSDDQCRGLYLQVRRAADVGHRASWIYRYTEAGRERQAGLGSYPLVTLAEARVAATDMRRERQAGTDPLDARRQAKIAAEPLVTFEQAAETYIARMAPSWAAGRDAQWRSSLQRHVYGVIGAAPVLAITTEQVLKVLTPIWTEIPELASKIRGRIAAVIDAAAAQVGGTDRANPARWMGHLAHVLPDHRRRIVKHHTALPYAQGPDFYRGLMARRGTATRLLAYTVLTACRSGEARLAIWSEISPDGTMWTVPAARSKTRKEHRVPLSAVARALLDQQREERPTAAPGDFIFPGQAKGRPLSTMAMTGCLRRMGQGNLTVHGFRSTFRDWAADKTEVDCAVVEQALAHSIGAVEKAYRRSDLYEKRAELMGRWADFLSEAGRGPE